MDDDWLIGDGKTIIEITSDQVSKLIGGEPLHPVARNFVTINYLGAAHSEDFVILACTVLTQITNVTDGQTDGETDRQTDRQTNRRWLRRAKHSTVARKNGHNLGCV